MLSFSKPDNMGWMAAAEMMTSVIANNYQCGNQLNVEVGVYVQEIISFEIGIILLPHYNNGVYEPPRNP